MLGEFSRVGHRWNRSDHVRALNHLDQTGAIEVGKWADVIVADRNILTASEEPIGTAKVLMTLVGGAIVYGDLGVDW